MADIHVQAYFNTEHEKYTQFLQIFLFVADTF